MTTTNSISNTVARSQLIELIKEVGGRYRETPVKLAGGGETHIYLDIKGVLDRGSRLTLAAKALALHMEELAGINQVTAIGGPTMGADVLAHGVAAFNLNGRDLKWFAVRDHAKTDHGLGRWIEGAELGPDDYVILTDDVASTGKSLIEAYERITATGAHVVAVMPLVDRAGKTGPRFEELGVPYFPLIEYAELGIESL